MAIIVIAGAITSYLVIFAASRSECITSTAWSMAKGLDSCSDGSVRTNAGDEASCTIAEG